MRSCRRRRLCLWGICIVLSTALPEAVAGSLCRSIYLPSWAVDHCVRVENWKDAGLSRVVKQLNDAKGQKLFHRAGILATQQHHLRGLVLFVGHPRSAHTLVGSILDSHPSFAISNELGLASNNRIVDQWKARPLRETVLQMVLTDTMTNAKVGREQTGYDYSIKGQGSFHTLLFAGDKKGGETTKMLLRNFSAGINVLYQLQDVVRVPIYFLRVVRNPYDNIAAIMRYASPLRNSLKHTKKGEGIWNKTQTTVLSRWATRSRIEQFVKLFFAMVYVNDRLNLVFPNRTLVIHSEHLMHSPTTELERWCQWFNVTAPPDWIGNVKEILFSSPHHAAEDIEWNHDTLARIQMALRGHPIFHAYARDQPKAAAS